MLERGGVYVVRFFFALFGLLVGNRVTKRDIYLNWNFDMGKIWIKPPFESVIFSQGLLPFLQSIVLAQPQS